jgi:hypothetical protein
LKQIGKQIDIGSYIWIATNPILHLHQGYETRTFAAPQESSPDKKLLLPKTTY